MKKSNIKVHLIDEQTGRNSGIVHPQAGNDSVRRMMGSGDSGSGGSGSGDGGSGGDENSVTNQTFTKTMNFQYSEEGVTWDGTAFLRVHLTVYPYGSIPRFSVSTCNMSYRIEGNEQVSYEGTNEITETGNTIISNAPLPLNCDPYFEENTAQFTCTQKIHLSISQSYLDTTNGKRTSGPGKDFERTLFVEFEISADKNSNSISYTTPKISIS